MSILIKGIDLPKKSETTQIILYGDGRIVVNEEKWDEDGNPQFNKSYNTQAIQIDRPHGRLIDEKELLDKIKRVLYAELGAEDIANAPTILEAEE